MPSNLNLEIRVLRLLCVGTPQGSVRNTLLPRLHGYAWQSTLHQVIFDTIAAAPSSDPEVLRQLLPAKLTRMGFPDVEWEEIFSPPSLSSEEAIALVRQMVAGE